MKKLLCLFYAVTFLVSCEGPTTRGPNVGSEEYMTALAVTSDTDALKGLKLGSKIVLESLTPTAKPAQTATANFKEPGSSESITLIIPIVDKFDSNKVVLLGTMENGGKVYALIVRNIHTWITFSLKNGNTSNFMGELIIPPKSEPIELIINRTSSSYKIMKV